MPMTPIPTLRPRIANSVAAPRRLDASGTTRPAQVLQYLLAVRAAPATPSHYRMLLTNFRLATLEVPQPSEMPTPAVPEAPITPIDPDPGTPADPAEPVTVPQPQEPPTPIDPDA
jgi:hypothetical protein